MELEIVATYDTKAQCFGQPLFVRNVGQGIRWFTTILQDQQTEIGRFPADYSLMHIASYDDETGIFKNLPGGPTLVVSGFTIAASLATQPAEKETPPAPLSIVKN